jgi:hypothetical protein
MRIKETKVYEFAELTDEARDKAIEKLYDINVDNDWWDSISDDASTIGLEIEEFDIDRGSYCRGRFTKTAVEVARSILENHGETCETYKTAEQYIKQWDEVDALTPDDEDLNTEEIDEEFLKSLCEDYRMILTKEYEYLTTREAIIETIEANEYEFDENGNIA